MLQTVLAHLRVYRSAGHEVFLSEHPSPALVFAPFQPLDDTGFQTLRGATLRSGTPTVAMIEKREGTNPFAQMITLGRARNNDIELKAASISKFHGYFTQNDSGAVFFTDGGSSFGTHVGGRPLIAKIPQELEPGQKVVFGSVEAVFYDAAGFANFLREHVPPGSEG